MSRLARTADESGEYPPDGRAPSARLKLMNVLKRLILWEYPRMSWQYDVIVAAIVAFVFITPNYVSFGDRPKAASVAMVRGGYWIEPQQLTGIPEDRLAARATSVVNKKFKTHVSIASVEPIFDDDERELKGYLAFPEK